MIFLHFATLASIMSKVHGQHLTSTAVPTTYFFESVTNELCDDSSWNVINGDWAFNSTSCSLQNSNNESEVDTVWFGSADGQTPDCRYCHENFVLTIIFAIHSGVNGRAGVLFRAKNVSVNWAMGTSYDIRTAMNTNEKLQFFIVDSSGSKLQQDAVRVTSGIAFDSAHNLTLVARGTLYDVYFDGFMLWENYNNSEYTDFSELGIGIRTFATISTFYALRYTPEITEPIPNPTTDPTFTKYPTSSPSIDPTSSPSIDPTSSPSIDPTSSPSIDPTSTLSEIPTLVPTVDASHNPAAASTNKSAIVTVIKMANTSTSSNLSIMIMVTISFILLVFCSLTIFWRKHTKRSKSILCVNNALVAIISIGDYSDSFKVNEADKDVPGVYRNLEVEKDIETLNELCTFMRWTFTSKGQKVHWTEKEIVSFIETEIGEMMFTADGELNYDGLIVFISCHGITRNIVTSDFKAMEKTAIHRMLSLKYPMLREIPRIFVFDCCNGSDEKRSTIEMENDQSKLIELVSTVEEKKNIALDDVQNFKMNTGTSSTKNPDYNLVEVHAANFGYVAHFGDQGSYLVDVLAQAIRRNVEMNMNQGLAELLEEVQNTLHDTGHQQTVNILNNHTRSMVFKKNPRK